MVFTAIATAIALIVKYSVDSEEDPLTVFTVSELFGYGFAVFVFVLAILEGLAKAKIVIKQFNKIPDRVRKDYSLELIQKPLNPKYWFMQFQIAQMKNGVYHELDERTKKEVLDKWL